MKYITLLVFALLLLLVGCEEKPKPDAPEEDAGVARVDAGTEEPAAADVGEQADVDNSDAKADAEGSKE